MRVALAAALGLAAVAVGWWWWSERRGPRGGGAEVAPSGPVRRPRVTNGADAPEWDRLEAAAGTLTAEEVRKALEIYAPAGAGAATLSVDINVLHIVTERDSVPVVSRTIALAGTPGGRAMERYWRPAAEMPAMTDPARPLEGVRIALDPGHIGGNWARMEERWYRLPDRPLEVKEGELTLTTAQLLKPSLEAMGAEVSLVRERLEPVTAMRPENFVAQAGSLREAEKLFYRATEIRARARVVNQELRPDLVVCLHFNAEPWGSPDRIEFSPANHLHMLVNGHYGPDELDFDDQRYECLLRLFQRTHEEEIPLSAAVGLALATSTGLPPYDYEKGHMIGNAHRALAANPYVWARNLLANRTYQCPVVFCEPYVMNNREVYERIAAGDYPGEKEVAGAVRRSIFRDYADGVANGLRDYYLQHRRRP